MKDLIERVSNVYGLTLEQAVKVVQLIQNPDTLDKEFWEKLMEICDKRIKNEPII